MIGSDGALAAWLGTRPESVRKLAAEFPPGTAFDFEGERWYVLGYNENDRVIMSSIDPYENYDDSLGSTCRMCAQHLRDAIKAGAS